jgi:hypothetical protein
MAILDMQDMKSEARQWNNGSDLSVALCYSAFSNTLCL